MRYWRARIISDKIIPKTIASLKYIPISIHKIMKTIGDVIINGTIVNPLSNPCSSAEIIETSFPDVALCFECSLNLNIFLNKTPLNPFLIDNPR